MTDHYKESNELIVLAAPISNYYKKFKKQIISFQIEYAKKILASKDDVIILTNKSNMSTYSESLGKNRVLDFPMHDIWMRDFTITNPHKPIMFRYTAAGQGVSKNAQKLADNTQYQFLKLANKSKLSFIKTDLLNDGGNLVDNYYGDAILSKKFLVDNKLNISQATKKLLALGFDRVAFIEPDEPYGLQHSDGIVSFINKDNVIINTYQDRRYTTKLKYDISNALPNVNISEIVTSHCESTTYDKNFGSAFGLYVNMLVTNNNIYLPQYGIDTDMVAISQMEKITTKNIIPINCAEISKLGGSVRCMSLQLKGENRDKLMRLAEKSL
ncbi:agmatine deiminase family protein [Francisella sp. XLW-1]|uniref:agmatine deiminase family protein n=1 Tax=Francisella sp. XLW-1 TaxID=2610887 RepID=UPI00123D1A32|nr:agmatine deiminase family protein [Francisella sp. XLW-1]